MAAPADRIWIARDEDGTVVGSIAVDLSHGPREAHLRWFLVSREARGTGLGRRLLNDAVAYCDDGGAEATTLWTFQGLDTARAMYEKHGFALVSEQSGDRWGRKDRRRATVPTPGAGRPAARLRLAVRVGQQASYFQASPSRVHGCACWSNLGRPCTL
ncbi:GNAT family N-acetyltransferase [Streptomyces sp. NPDC050263]|uniref:GNAT family N-acetyltransferase n=1 Tax=Streptomyces sp. NPDC050263 TaxID=3155037 RepID=UPI0034340D88